jgi:molybdopterin-guanine dinucleotide biosynthesis protein
MQHLKVTISGPAKSGKSALVQALAAALDARGMSVMVVPHADGPRTYARPMDTAEEIISGKSVIIEEQG